MRRFLKYSFTIIIIPLLITGNFSFTLHKGEKKINKGQQTPYLKKSNINDGPYIFNNNDNIIVKWVRNGKLIEKDITNKNYKFFKRRFGFYLKPEWINENTPNINYKQEYKNVENFIAVSDIHGQYDVFLDLLRQYNVIDRYDNWNFGNGHLVIAGDILDRGPKVTESLWLIYKLEKQALEHGGMVHVLLGNHELMVLNNDLRYINPKYLETAKIMGINYNKLFADNTVLGEWLLKKPVIITINDILFVHAGVSFDFINNGFTPESTNHLFIDSINGQGWEKILHNKQLSFLMGDNGPVWYRGYFEDPSYNSQKVDRILEYFNVNHIIVGHTSFPNIISLFDGKIFGIDSSIKLGTYGEIFIYKKGKIFRGTSQGALTNP